MRRINQFTWKSTFHLFVIAIIFSGCMISCKKGEGIYVEDLNQNWVFKKVTDTQWLPATVPGCVHTDLINNHIIKDPFYRFGEDSVQWIELEDWEYQTTFEVSKSQMNKDHIDLIFEGLDTYADVYLNDALILKSENMFVGHRVSCKKYIGAGLNELRIRFNSPIRKQEEKLRNYVYLPYSANENMPEDKRTRVFTRKAPFHYGWDWGPRLVTSGIWRPVKLMAWSNARIEDVYLKPVSVTSQCASYKARSTVYCDKPLNATLLLWVDGTKTAASNVILKPGINEIDLPFTIDKPNLWWPNGWGKHYMYQIDVEVRKGRTIMDESKNRLGVRTIELVRQKDSIGESFLFKVNGIPMFMKGANYIPPDILSPRVSSETYQRVIGDAVAGNMNMLRLWGGSYYENDMFFDMLDDNGILVWQDFMFACDMMPYDTALLHQIQLEAAYNVKRLRNHPCMALWCGNNENYIAWELWKWKDRYPDEQQAKLWRSYQAIYHEILPKTISQLHPEIYYWESSPQNAKEVLPNRKSGDEHDWKVWFADSPFSDYGQEVPRFASEYGVQSFPYLKTLQSFARDTDLAAHSAVMTHRQRSHLEWIQPGLDGNGMIERYIERYYKKPKDFYALIYLSQVMQAEAFQYAIETHRKNMPRCMGSLYWQLNDCWPTVSWAGIDYFGRWKAAHYRVKKANESLIIVPELGTDGRLTVYVVSDRLAPINASLTLSVIDLYGREKYLKTLPVVIHSNGSTLCFEQKDYLNLNGIHPSNVVFKAELKQADHVLAQNHCYLVPAHEMALEKTSVAIKQHKTAGGIELELTSSCLTRSVYVYSETDGFFSDNFFDLMPNVPVNITFTPDSPTEKPVFKTYSMADSY